MKKVAFAMGLVMSVISGVAAAAGWSVGPSYITNIEVGASPSETWLTFASTPSNKPAACTSVQAFVSASNDQIRTVATAALLSGKEVRVYWEATCKSGTTYGQISRIELVN